MEQWRVEWLDEQKDRHSVLLKKGQRLEASQTHS
jgi:hypothetical protein